MEKPSTDPPVWASHWNIGDVIQALDFGSDLKSACESLARAAMSEFEQSHPNNVSRRMTLATIWPKLDAGTQDRLERAFVMYDIARL